MSSSPENHTVEIQPAQYLAPRLILDKVDQHHFRWLELRKGRVSSSNVAVICGLNPYKSPLELWAEWTGKVTDTFKGNKATQLGTALEPLVAQWFCERTGLQARRANALYQDAEFDWLVASPDYILESGDPLEIKTGNPRTAHRWHEGTAPLEYVLQVQIQMRVLMRRRGVLTAYLGDLENMPDVAVDYDEELFRMVREKAESFLDCVKRDIPPQAGAGDAELLRAIYKREEGAQVLWTGDNAESVAYLLAQAKEAAEVCSIIRKKLDAADKTKKELENRIKQFLGNATVGELPDGRRVKLTTVHVSEKVVGAYSFDRMSLPK